MRAKKNHSTTMNVNATEIDSIPTPKIQFSITSLVSNHTEYQEMLKSFEQAGFTTSDCEFLFIDNSKRNKYDAYSGMNKLISSSKGSYVILCHQDIRLYFDDRKILEARLASLDKSTPNWGVLGNSGGSHQLGRLHQRISDKGHQNAHTANLPATVSSLDENFLIIKRSANLGLSNDLSGFHLYGTDLCVHAQTLGYSSHVIDFHLKHLGEGKIDQSFHDMRKRLILKYQRAFKNRPIQTPCTQIYLSGNAFRAKYGNSKAILRSIRRLQTLKRILQHLPTRPKCNLTKNCHTGTN